MTGRSHGRRQSCGKKVRWGSKAKFKGVWKRYIDDIFMIWTHGEDELNAFVNHLNSCHDTIKLTMESSKTEIPFLDTLVRLKNNRITTELYTKPTDSHNYLRFDSCHPRPCVKAIPYSQFLRVQKICSDRDDFLKHCRKLCFHFFRHGYPHELVHEALIKAGNLERMDLLKPKSIEEKANSFICVTRYHPNCSPIAKILKNNWEILARNDSTSWIFESGYKIAYKRPRSLRNFLIRAKLSMNEETNIREPLRKSTCGNIRCRYCPKISMKGRISNSARTKTFWTYTNVNCESNNLIYCIECKRCSLKYVGQTGNAIKERFRNHFYLISKKNGQHHVPRHFNSSGHCGLSDVTIHILGFVHTASKLYKSKLKRLELEGLWQHRLGTIRPHGLNTLDET